VTAAALQNGLLVIDLVRELPEAMKPRRVAITAGAPAAVGAVGVPDLKRVDDTRQAA